jgi:hypothetical protein
VQRRGALVVVAVTKIAAAVRRSYADRWASTAFAVGFFHEELPLALFGTRAWLTAGLCLALMLGAARAALAAGSQIDGRVSHRRGFRVRYSSASPAPRGHRTRWASGSLARMVSILSLSVDHQNRGRSARWALRKPGSRIGDPDYVARYRSPCDASDRRLTKRVHLSPPAFKRRPRTCNSE